MEFKAGIFMSSSTDRFPKLPGGNGAPTFEWKIRIFFVKIRNQTYMGDEWVGAAKGGGRQIVVVEVVVVNTSVDVERVKEL